MRNQRLASRSRTVGRDRRPCSGRRRPGQFPCWLDDAASRGSVTETQAAERLEKFRETNDRFRGLSFPTISGAGSNGAIVHYRAAPQTNRRWNRKSIPDR